MKQLKKGSSKLLNAWASYDWANSVYSLVIASAIFPIYYGQLFKEKGNLNIEVFGTTLKSTALISFTTAAAFLMVSIFSPLLSGIADYIGNKKLFMKFFCYLGALSTIGLCWFDLDSIYFSLACYFFGLIGFWGSLVFYNSYLPDIAFPEQQDNVSAKGYSMGYLGSVILLIINLAMVMKPDWFGITGTEGEAAIKAMQYSFISVGVWWIVFSQYAFYYLPKGTQENGNKMHSAVVFNGFKELKKVWHLLEDNLRLKRYLLSFFIYSMAVQTVMLAATYFGEQEIAWESDGQRTMGLIISILVIQLVAVLGAVITSRASEKFGNIPTLIVINCIWMVICVCAYFVVLPVHFYVTAGFVGLVMGGIQSLSRSTYSKFLPETKDTASFFSFYDVSEKIGIVIGMLLYGLIDQITGSMRNSIVFLAVLFASGVFLLIRVPKK
ncbi:MFS-type transporter yxiO [Flavobacterium enshiense DK69]|uniref:MFS transporter permease n=1 Tax=Flavobacterium enshiense DK69 TaxID=1107311 RepID=V6S4L3_9FLAO|nr:MFS transporter [Flavobacterium enshiense]ESU21177.1 MFS-type transporter yxiO [Flavobacterium enshiense DK69]KGO92799.1 MFS transporter permease [Flavobacterium enshiense DK69]